MSPSSRESQFTAATPVSSLRMIVAGATGAIVTVAVTLTLGVFAFAPVGDVAAQFGIAASFASATVSAAVMASRSSGSLPIAGPSSATALIFAGLIAQLLTNRALPPPSLDGVLLCLAVAVLLCGLLQLAMARAGLAKVVRFVPHPVLAGFMNGIAVLVLLAQVPALLALGRQTWDTQHLSALPQAQAGALALGLGTAGLVWLLAWRAPRLPAGLIGLVAGTLVYHLALFVWPGAPVGPTVAGSATQWPPLGALLLMQPEPPWSVLGAQARAIAVTAVLMAVVGGLESVLSLRALDHHLDERHDENRELAALGWANVAGGCVGALPAVVLRARAIAIAQAGGRGRIAAYGAVIASALLFALGGPFFGLLPEAVLAGAMLTIGVALADRRSLTLVKRWLFEKRRGPPPAALRHSLIIIAVVCALTVWQGAAAGVVVGVLMSAIAFMRGMNRSLVRARFTGAMRPSRRIYPPAAEQVLQPARSRIVVLELEGALYFGSAERLADEMDALPADCRCVVLDFRRVGSIDESGAMVLARLMRRLERQGTALLLAHVAEQGEHARRLRDFGADGPHDHHLFGDADLAIEHAEQQLLAQNAGPTALAAHSVAAQDNALLAGLDQDQAARVLGVMRSVRLTAGQTLFHQGDAANGVYLVLQGSISIVATAQEGERRQRFVSLSPGTLFGEMAMIDGRGRSADAIADVDSELMLLGTEELAALSAEEPAVGAALYRNMARYLAERLRIASMAWTAAAA